MTVDTNYMKKRLLVPVYGYNIDYRDYVYGIGNALISRDTPPNTGHTTLVHGGHKGAAYLSKMADTGSC